MCYLPTDISHQQRLWLSDLHFVTIKCLIKLTNVTCVVLFRQEIEMKQCSPYVQENRDLELYTTSQNEDCSGDYELVGGNENEDESVYENVRGES